MNKFLCIAALLVPSLANAQAFSGVATSISGKPLPNAQVTVCSGWSDILLQNPQQSCNGQYPLTPPSNPSLIATSGSNPPAGAYKIVITYLNPLGQTIGSAPTSITTTGGNLQITVFSPPAFSNATGWNVFFTVAGGSALFQQNTSPIAIGTNFVQSVVINTSGVNPPGSSTATNNILSLATTYSNVEETTTLSNPFNADSNGRYVFIVLPGAYTVSISATSYSTYSYEVSVSGGVGSLNQQIFTSGGTFTIPTPKVKVTVVGGGGSGGGAVASSVATGGGAGGAATSWLTGLTPGNTITVTVGSGGAAATNANGNSGTSSSIASGTQTITTVTANGGNGGFQGAGSVPGGGGTATGGTLNFTGGAGVPAWNASGSEISGSGGNSIFGGGGTGGNANNCTAGGAPGAGGGASSNGASNATSCSGANGIVIFEWVQ